MRFSLAVVLVLSSLHAQAVPDGLSGSDWSSIRAAYEAGRHRLFAVDGGHQARSPAQQWTVRFDGRGVAVQPDAGDWTWGLELVSWGLAGDEHGVGKPHEVRADGQRLTYAWDALLDEWYVNGTLGLEHGYTVHRRPDGDGTLTLLLRVRGGLSPVLQNSGRDVVFQLDGVTVLDYTGLSVVDANGLALPARFTVAQQGLLLSVDDRSARYPITVDPVAQRAYLKASNTGSSDFFGHSVAVANDTVVVGAPGEASNATGVNGNQADNSFVDAGAVYVFVRGGATWTQQAYIKASNSGAGDLFGHSVSISNDTLVVGAWREDSNATGVNGNQGDNSASGAGAAYVFVRIGSTWTQQAYLKASNSGSDDQFGNSVSISADTIAVAAVTEDSNAVGVNGNQANDSAIDAGAAYVFVRSGTTWTQQAYLKASNTEAGDFFGWSLSLSGDTVVVSAEKEDSSATGVNGNQSDNSATDAGAAYVFVRSGTTWTQQAYLKASNTEATDGFGFSVAASGNNVVVGARFEDSNATGTDGNQANNSAVDSGAAYWFWRSGTTWTQAAYLKASNTDANDWFGFSVAASGNNFVVGARFEDSNATGVNGNQADNSVTSAGAAYVFDGPAQIAYLKASNAGAHDVFGYSVAVSDDMVVVGAFGEASNATGVAGGQWDNSVSLAGAAYVFDIRSGGLGSIPLVPQLTYLKASNTGASDRFGAAVAIAGDTVVIGAPGEGSNATGVNGNQADNSARGAGAAYVFVRSGSTWTQQAYLKASNTDAGDAFGAAVSISDDTIVVGAAFEASTLTSSQFDNSVSGAGAAYVFVRSGTTWTQQRFLKASNTPTALVPFDLPDQFGGSVSISGDTIVVGAENEDSNATGVNGNQSDNTASSAGAAYVFQRSGTTWTQQAYLKASNTGSVDFFGRSVSISGDTIVVGARGEDSNATGVNGNQADNSAGDAGAAYVFVRSGTTWAQQAYLKASNTGSSDVFGRSLSISGDTIVVGASNEDSNATGVNGNQSDNSATDAGAAYVFKRSGTTWAQQAYLKASNTGSGDLFGGSVSIAEDTIVVGAEREDSNATGVNGNQGDNSAGDAGAAYLFSRCGATWAQHAYLKGSNTEALDEFGVSVAASGDTIVVGAKGEDSNATGVNGNQADNSASGAGAAYVLAVPRLRPSLWPLNAPQIGQSYTLAIDNINPIFNLAILAFGFSALPGPGLDLSIANMPCCVLYLPLDILITPNPGAGGSTTWTWTSVTGSPGDTFHCQAFCLDPAVNAFGFTISNAITIRLVP